jgi:transposase InsO family protein
MFMPKAQGYCYIVAARDDLTGVCEAQPLKTCMARTLSTFFWKSIYCRYSIPLQVTTNNGAEVKAGFAVLIECLGVPPIKISPYNKHANGVVERGHFTLREVLVKAYQGQITQWPDLLAKTVFAD